MPDAGKDRTAPFFVVTVSGDDGLAAGQHRDQRCNFPCRPPGVFMLFVRKASAKRFWRLSVWKVFRARGFASIAARRSSGIEAVGRAANRRIGGVPAAIRLGGVDLSLPGGCMRPAAVSRATCSRMI